MIYSLKKTKTEEEEEIRQHEAVFKHGSYHMEEEFDQPQMEV